MKPLLSRLLGAALLLLAACWIVMRGGPAPATSRAVANPAATAPPGRPAHAAATPQRPAADRPAAGHRLDCACLSCATGGAERLPRLPLADPPAWLAAVDRSGDLPLPGGRTLRVHVERLERAPDGSLVMIEGTTNPPGRFLFRRESQPGEAWPMWGFVHLRNEDSAWRIENQGDRSFLAETPADLVACRRFAPPPAAADPAPEEIPANHPTDIPIPDYQNGVIPLESLPGATAVIYLDFDGQAGPHEGWGDFDALPATNLSASSIKGVWQRVAEDYAPFNINVTTDLAVFLAAPDNGRQRCIVTPTTTAAPGAGGVAYIGSFNSSGDQPCWAFYSTGKSSAEVISHEVGHTLKLGHDGRTDPSEGYYGGHGTDPVGWAPIMGVGYYKNLSQWSKGEYLNANQTEDDTAIIATNNNVDLRNDDAGNTLATAAHLEILPDNSVANEGVITTPADVDAFRFKTSGGSVSLAVTQVASGPNLDILAELRDASNNLVASSNPDTALNATITASLTAGEYTLQVGGTGRGDPLGDGYTDYGSLGAYTITGSVAGGDKPDRFQVAENPAAGATIGTVTPRLAHGANPLTFAISSSTPAGAVAIAAATGQLSVANPAQFDFESLSPSWETPARIELMVTVTDTVNPSLNESVRAVVTVTDANEPPTLAGGTTTLPTATAAGTHVLTPAAADPDRFQSHTFSITAGNGAGWFAIDPQTGAITVANPPTAAATVNLTVRVADSGSPTLAATAGVTLTVYQIPAGYTPGSARRTLYDAITGETVANLTGNARFPLDPDREVALAELADTTRGDDYGSTVRAFLFPPVTGSYTFWIAGDDATQLLLSTTANPAGATSRASFTGWTDYLQWNKYSSQQSSAISLTAGQACYLEVRHKEGGGGDHVAVAWQASSGGTVVIPQQVIPVRYLAPHFLNYQPRVTGATVTLYETAYPGTTVATMAATDLNPGQSNSYAIAAGNAAGAFGIDPASGRVFVADATKLDAATTPGYTLTVAATDDGSPPRTGSGTLTVQVRAAAALGTTGIVHEIWDGLSGTALSGLYASPKWPLRPDRVRVVNGLNSGTDLADNYGARLRAYVIPPATGAYTFWLASDDQGVLLVSPNDSPASAVQRASVSGYSSPLEWTKYSTQQSTPLTLTAGQRYFVEARVKEGGGGDHVAIGWTGPGITEVTVPSGLQVEPYDSNTPPVFGAASYSFATDPGNPAGTPVGTLAATSQPFETLTYAILSGDPRGAFAINPQSGAITVANPANVAPGTLYQLVAGAQDDGYGGLFPPDAATVPVAIQVSGTPVNQPPFLTLVRPATASAGIPAGCGVLLEVAAQDDGLPATPGAVTVAWSQLAGPGTAAFTRPAAAATGATFTAAGTWQLRATASDGELSTTLDVTVTVGAAGASGNLAPAVGAGADFTASIADAPVLAGSVTDDGAPFSNATYVAPAAWWRYRKGTSEASSPVDAWRQRVPAFTEDATWLDGRTPVGYGDSDDNTVLADMSGGYSSVYLRKPFQVPAGRIPDRLTMRVYVDDGAVVWINGSEAARLHVGSGQLAYDATASNHEAAWETVTLANARSLLVAGTNLIAVHALNQSSTSTDFSIDAELATDRVPAALSHAWSMVSGPGSATFANPADPATAASFSTPGTYLLRLTADDGETATYDEVAATVNPLPPIDQWRARVFGPDANNPLLAGTDRDPDRDGLVNLLEYACGLDPLAHPQAADPLGGPLRIDSGPGTLALTFRRNLAATDVTLHLEHSPTLGPDAAWLPVTATQETIAEADGVRLVRVTLADPQTLRSFFRLRATLAAP